MSRGISFHNNSIKMLISVIVPVYKVEPYLDRCIQSIVEQTYTNIEIILIDDGSPDECPAKCDQWAEKDSRITVVHKENEGVSSARNSGIDISSGDFIFFVDSDDIVHPQALELLVRCQQQFHTDYVIARHIYGFANSWYKEKKDYNAIQTKRLNLNEFLAEQNEKGFVHGHLIRKLLIGDIRFPDEISVGEDAVFNYSLLQLPQISFSILETELYCYCYRSDSAAAQKRGFEGYYLTAEWCNNNINRFKGNTKGLIIKEALKKCFLYRYEFANEDEGIFCKANKSLIISLIKKCKNDHYISFKEKLVYTIMAFFPFTYRLYVTLLNSIK